MENENEAQESFDNAVRLGMELWTKIEEYDNYEVSTLGRVRNVKTERILKPHNDTNGYYSITLCKNGITKRVRIHNLVANSFIPNPDNKRCVDHVDNDRKNNCVSNLRRATNLNLRKKKLQNGWSS